MLRNDSDSGQSKKMAVTLKQIAKQAGFSVTTVSRALGGHDDVNEGTRQHILAIASELGYHPNLVARQLQRQKSDTIGIVTTWGQSSVEDDYFSVLIRGIGYAAARNQFDVLLSRHYPKSSDIDPYRRLVDGNRVDGMIVARTTIEDERIRFLQSRERPFVVAGRLSADELSDFVYIDTDSRVGMRALTEHFVAYGHRRIGFIASPANLAFSAYRLLGYQEGLEQAGIAFQPELVVEGDLTRSGGREAAADLLERAPELTAIIACNDLMAIGAIRAAQERGYAVGQDIAIGGFDNIPASQHAAPPLTTISQPIFMIGELLAQTLIQLINGQAITRRQILLKPELIVRESSGQPRYGGQGRI